MRRPSAGSSLALFFVAAVVTLAACGALATRGTMPPPGPDGRFDASQMPDFIGFVGQTDHVVGWVPKAYLIGNAPPGEAIPVYADDLRTLIGHSVPGKGFVPLGVDASTVRDIPVQVGPSAP